jgi:hemerythrin-like domain-containing protein
MEPHRVDEILARLRQDHELVAAQVRVLAELDQAVTGAETRDFESALKLLGDASQFFQTRLLPHLDDEEHGMFLLLRENLPRGSTLIYELESEHEQLRKLCERLSDDLDWLRHERYRKRSPLIADLRTLCAEICRLLCQHAEREDRLIAHYLKADHADRSETGSYTGRDAASCGVPSQQGGAF